MRTDPEAKANLNAAYPNIDNRKQNPAPPAQDDHRSAQYETLLNLAPLGVYLVDADFRILEMNPTARRVFGANSDLIGQNLEEVLHGIWPRESADELISLFRHTLETGESYETAERSEDRIDSQVTEHHEWRLDRITLPDKRNGVVCYLRDISSRVQAQARIVQSEERYRGIVNQSVGAIAEADPTGHFTMVNDRFCAMTGYTRAELLNIGMLDLTHPEDIPRSRELLEQLIDGGEAYEIEKRYLRKDGSLIWVHKSASAVRAANGTLQSLIAVLIDITHSKQIENALQQLNLHLENLVQERTAELRRAIHSLEAEIARRIRVEEELSLHRDRLRELSWRLVEVQEEERRAIARELHDRVGQSLTALNLNLTTIQDQLPDEALERVGSRLTDTIHLLEGTIPVIRDLMANLRPALLDEYGLIVAIKTHLKEFSARYGIQVSFDEPVPPLPRLEKSIEITILRISQEALINIAKHARASRAALTLAMEAGAVCLSVEDDGVGIEPEHKSEGHGLTIMRERAEAVGGTLSIVWRPGMGTRIEIRIPAFSDPHLSSPRAVNP